MTSTNSSAIARCLVLGMLLLVQSVLVLAEEGSGHWVVIANEEVVGTLDARFEASAVFLDYHVDNNGRGPQLTETLGLSTAGMPLDWKIDGSSLFGAPVHEEYAWRDGSASWRSQADQGSAMAEQPGMYIAGDASPWALGLYARALLEAQGHELDVLPSGRMRLRRLETLVVGADQREIILYELSGIQLQPQLLALDADLRLFASFGGRSGLIEKGYEGTLPRLREWAQGYELRRLQSLQSHLAHRIESAVRYRNVRIFDSVSGRLGAPVSVLVRAGRIAAVEPAGTAGNPAGERWVDGAGGTLVPGLVDMHAHNSLQSGLFYLAAGVTTTRDMGNDNALLAEIRRATGAGELAGPYIVPAGLIEARSPYSARIGIVADTLDEALEAVRWYADNGYREIKSYNSMQPDWVPPLAEEARRLGLGLTGHVPAFMSPDAVIEAGFDAIAHINQLMLGWLLEPGEDTRTALRLTAMKRAAQLDLDDPRVKHTVRLMQDHGTALDTTAVILERLMLSRAGEVQPGDRPYLAHMPIGYQRYRKRTFVPLAEPGDDAAYREAFEVLLRVIKLLHDNGIRLLPGTDDATGFTVHRELELYAEAGIPVAEVLSLATMRSADYLGVADETGSIEVGKRADFFLVPGDPTRDISVIRRARLVSRGGLIYFPEAIYTALGIEPFAPAASISHREGDQ